MEKSLEDILWNLPSLVLYCKDLLLLEPFNSLVAFSFFWGSNSGPKVKIPIWNSKPSRTEYFVGFFCLAKLISIE